MRGCVKKNKLDFFGKAEERHHKPKNKAKKPIQQIVRACSGLNGQVGVFFRLGENFSGLETVDLDRWSQPKGEVSGQN